MRFNPFPPKFLRKNLMPWNFWSYAETWQLKLAAHLCSDSSISCHCHTNRGIWCHFIAMPATCQCSPLCTPIHTPSILMAGHLRYPNLSTHEYHSVVAYWHCSLLSLPLEIQAPSSCWISTSLNTSLETSSCHFSLTFNTSSFSIRNLSQSFLMSLETRDGCEFSWVNLLSARISKYFQDIELGGKPVSANVQSCSTTFMLGLLFLYMLAHNFLN